MAPSTVVDKKVILIILDGYGHSDEHEHNAIYLAKKPHIDEMEKDYPHSLLTTSGTAVGLPEGVMGNSEVGHLNIGAGRVIKQEFTKIADFAKEKGFETLPDVKRVMTSGSGNLHIMGLLSDGGVHSHIDHLLFLLQAAKRLDVKKKIYIHAVTDGRDTPPQSALEYVAQLEEVIKKTGQGEIATICGRFFLMDRDKRWERVRLAYDALVFPGKSSLPSSGAFSSPESTSGDPVVVFPSARAAVEDAYKKGENDEFIKPRQVTYSDADAEKSRIHPEDCLIFINFRADRAREISQALTLDFKEFPTPVKLNPKNYVTFTKYEVSFPFPVLFHPDQYRNLLGEIVSEKGESQLRIAETEKYAHVTYFFNGGVEKIFPGEDRSLIPSPKDVATYDLKPEMSADKLTDELFKKVDEKKYKLIVLNFANGDMVGHTGVEPAAIKAVEVLDRCLGRIKEKFLSLGYDILITADHGNSECMVDPETHNPYTAHTTNPVPLMWVSRDARGKKLKDGILADIAPTILSIYGWPQPSDMTGHSLIVK